MQVGSTNFIPCQLKNDTFVMALIIYADLQKNFQYSDFGRLYIITSISPIFCTQKNLHHNFFKQRGGYNKTIVFSIHFTFSFPYWIVIIYSEAYNFIVIKILLNKKVSYLHF
jgi:hypothetical protein